MHRNQTNFTRGLRACLKRSEHVLARSISVNSSSLYGFGQEAAISMLRQERCGERQLNIDVSVVMADRVRPEIANLSDIR